LQVGILRGKMKKIIFLLSVHFFRRNDFILAFENSQYLLPQFISFSGKKRGEKARQPTPFREPEGERAQASQKI